MDHQSSMIGYGSRDGETFKRYYLRNVAISEGCGCAELLITRNMPANHGVSVIPAVINLFVAGLRRMFGNHRRPPQG